MKSYILRIEGVDFDNTVFDTQNLSIIRGSSLALLNAPRAVQKFLNEKHHTNKPSKIFTGASQGAFRIEAESADKAEDIAKAVLKFLNEQPETPDSKDKSPNISGVDYKARKAFSHLSFVVDVVEVKKDEKDIVALWRAHAKNRLSQMQAPRWPLPAFIEAAEGFAKNYDRLRPATEPWNDKKEQANRTLRDAQDNKDEYSDEASGCASPKSGSDKKQDWISQSGFDRFKYGRDRRENFYADFIAGDDEKQRLALRKAFKAKFTFCNDFEQIVADEPKDLPPSLENKIAVFYADGNKFSKIFNDQDPLEHFKKLSDNIVQKQQTLLKSILG